MLKRLSTHSVEAITVESHNILLFCRSSLCCFYCMKYPFRHYINSLMLKFLIDARTIPNVFLFILRDKGESLRRIPHTSHGSFNPYLNHYILRKHLQASSCLKSRREAVSQIFREKENHSKAKVPCSGFLLHGTSILFFTVTCVFFGFFVFVLPLKINIEIIKIVLLSIFNHEK